MHRQPRDVGVLTTLPVGNPHDADGRDQLVRLTGKAFELLDGLLGGARLAEDLAVDCGELIGTDHDRIRETNRDGRCLLESETSSECDGFQDHMLNGLFINAGCFAAERKSEPLEERATIRRRAGENEFGVR